MRQWRAKVATFNFDVEAVGGTVTALLRRAVELEQERLALSINDECAGTYREGNRAAGDGMTARSLTGSSTGCR